MRILITGATGFVGRAVTARLLSTGHQVVALARDPSAARARLPEAVQIVSWKTLGSGPHESGLPGDLDGVVHLAGESIAGGLWTASRKKKLWASRIEGTRNLIEALERNAKAGGRVPSAFVSASGLGYHGRQPEQGEAERLARVEDPPGSDFLGRLAAAWEAEAHRAEAFGARVVCVRLGMVLGKHGGALPPQILATRFGLGTVLGTGKQYWPWISLEDAANLFVQAVTNPEHSGPVWGATGEPVTQGEFARALGHALHRPVFLRVPRWALRLGLGEMADLFLHGQKVEGRVDARTSSTLSSALREILDS